VRTRLHRNFPVQQGKYREFPPDRAFRSEMIAPKPMQCLDFLDRFPTQLSREFFRRIRE
jgi:hypothetical protein